MMKKWYAVGPDLRLTDGLHCPYFDNTILVFGISDNIQLVKEFITQYEKFIDFRVIEFTSDVNRYNCIDLNNIRDILNEFNISPECIDGNYIYDSSSLELIRSNTDTIHPRYVTFTMLQMDTYIQENSESMYLFNIICKLGETLSSIFIMSNYIKDNEDIKQFIITLMTRYLVMHEVMSNFTITGQNTAMSLSNMIGYDNTATTISHYISNESLLGQFMKRLSAFDDDIY